MFVKSFFNLFGFLALGCAVLSAGEVKAQRPAGPQLKIELGQRFQNDLVKIYLDKKLVYAQQLSSADSVEITDTFFIPMPESAFVITVEINGEKFEKSRPKQAKELDDENYSLLINYNREAEEVEIKTKTVIILYD